MNSQLRICCLAAAASFAFGCVDPSSDGEASEDARWCGCPEGIDNYCSLAARTARCFMTSRGGYCDPNRDGNFDDADWARGAADYAATCGDPTPPASTQCACRADINNFCQHEAGTPGCSMTTRGGYCDPNGDGSFDDANWVRGWTEYRDSCTAAPAADAGVSISPDAGPPSRVDRGPSVTGPRRSAGCGSGSGSGSFVRREVDAGGRARSYQLLVPASYDANRAYPIVFRWHGSGGNGLDRGLPIEDYSREDAIVVGGNGERPGGGQYWDGADDVRFFDAMLAQLSQQYCIDLDRVFDYGFSSGGGMTNYLSCVRGNVVRAGAAVAGFEWSANCVGNPAIWLLHDHDDDAVSIDNGYRVRDRSIERNDCTLEAPTREGDSCVRYRGCSSPVVWCETRGIGHDPQASFSARSAWTFFSELR